jgi:hypothetical protein
MAKDHRTIQNGQPIGFTCENQRFMTNTAKGSMHGGATARGSVFPNPLINHGGYTLWLEHVVEKGASTDLFWLMWYDSNGVPTIPLSGIFDRNDLQEMVGQLATFVP